MLTALLMLLWHIYSVKRLCVTKSAAGSRTVHTIGSKNERKRLEKIYLGTAVSSVALQFACMHLGNGLWRIMIDPVHATSLHVLMFFAGTCGIGIVAVIFCRIFFKNFDYTSVHDVDDGIGKAAAIVMAKNLCQLIRGFITSNVICQRPFDEYYGETLWSDCMRISYMVKQDSHDTGLPWTSSYYYTGIIPSAVLLLLVVLTKLAFRTCMCKTMRQTLVFSNGLSISKCDLSTVERRTWRSFVPYLFIYTCWWTAAFLMFWSVTSSLIYKDVESYPPKNEALTKSTVSQYRFSDRKEPLIIRSESMMMKGIAQSTIFEGTSPVRTYKLLAKMTGGLEMRNAKVKFNKSSGTWMKNWVEEDLLLSYDHAQLCDSLFFTIGSFILINIVEIMRGMIKENQISRRPFPFYSTFR